MAYVPVPKDLTRVKTKVALNLTKRQLIFFSLAAAVGIPFYLFMRKPIGSSIAAILMVTIMLPFFFMAGQNSFSGKKYPRKAACFLHENRRLMLSEDDACLLYTSVLRTACVFPSLILNTTILPGDACRSAAAAVSAALMLSLIHIFCVHVTVRRSRRAENADICAALV